MKKKWILILLAVVVVLSVVAAFLLRNEMTPRQRLRRNCQMDEVIHTRTNDWDDLTTVTIIQTMEKELGCTNYTVKLYIVSEDLQGYTLTQLQGMKPEQAEAAVKAGVLTHACNATIQIHNKTDKILRFHHEALL